MHMHPLATRGQEDIALLPLDSGNMDGIEGEKKYQPQSNEHISTYKCKSMLILTDNGLTADPKICDDLEDDQSDDLQTLTFDDLLSVSFQVAKGMEFLSSRNVRDPEQHSLYCTWFLRITSLVSSLD